MQIQFTRDAFKSPPCAAKVFPAKGFVIVTCQERVRPPDSSQLKQCSHCALRSRRLSQLARGLQQRLFFGTSESGGA